MGVTPLNPPLWVWTLTIVGILAMLAYDFFFHVRKAHVPTMREAAVWSAVYVGIAVAFGIGVWMLAGRDPGEEYFAGYLTEKALSVDNLFVFLIIMGNFKVPRADQQKVLLFGIVFALIARTGFIFLGAALIESFAWIFYIFGLALIIMAGGQLKEELSDDEGAKEADNLMTRLVSKFVKTSPHYDGDKLFTVVDGRKVLTPMLLVMLSIGGTDILFAFDSIPAIFGLTQSTFLVFTTITFSLLGLRQLYFLIDGLLDRLIYLSYGLAAILAFIGVKLVLHALHENNLWFINEGEPVNVIEIPTTTSLLVILGALVVTVLFSLVSSKGRALALAASARRHATVYLDADSDEQPEEKAKAYDKMVAEVDKIKALPEKQHRFIREEDELLELLRRAEVLHGGGEQLR